MVDTAKYAGCHGQGIPRIFTLAGTLKSNGQILVQAIVANLQAGAAGDPYHMTVPPRFLELGQMREALSISGKFGEATMAARHAYLKRFFPDIGDRRGHCGFRVLPTSDLQLPRALLS